MAARNSSKSNEAAAKRSFSGGVDAAEPKMKKRRQDRDGEATPQFIEVLELADVYGAGSTPVAVRGGALAHFPASGSVGGSSSSSSFSALAEYCFGETLTLLPVDREKFAAEDSEFFAVTKQGDGAAQMELQAGSVQLADPIAAGLRRDKGRTNGDGGRMLPAGAPRICTSQTQTITTTRQALVQGYLADGKFPVLLSRGKVMCCSQTG